MKLSLTKKILSGVVIASLTYGGYAYFFKKKTTGTGFTTVTTTVKRGNIENSVEVIGVSALVYEQKMQFSQGGKVAKILFKEGDKVQKGQVMAELDTSDVLNDIQQQQISLSNAELKLAQILKWAEDKDILNARNTIKSTENRISSLENDIANIYRDMTNKQTDYKSQIAAKENSIKSNENDIKNKQVQLENAKNELSLLAKTENQNLSNSNTDLTKTLGTAVIDARKMIIDSESSLYSADEILGITDQNRTKNDSYEVYLGAKDSSLRNQTEGDWGRAKELLDTSKDILATLGSNQENTDIEKLLHSLEDTLDALVVLGKDGNDMVNASIVASSFTQSDITKYANVFSSILSSAQSSLSSTKNTIATIAKLSDPELQKAESQNIIRNKEQAITDLEYAISKLSVDTSESLLNDLTKIRNDMAYSEQTYEAQIRAKNTDISDAKNTLAYNQESLRILLGGATKEDIALARNAINVQRLALEKVRGNIKKYQLEAPFDGVLRKIDFKLGDNIVTGSSATPLYIYIENPNLVELSATVDQLDIVKLKIGQDARIVFDPFPTVSFTGKVSDINSTPTQTSGVTSYTVKSTMDKGKYSIFSGMSARVNIIIDSKKDTLVIWTSFVQKGREWASVLKRVGSEDQRTDVVLGISNPSNTEILSGVTEGDTIVRRIASGSGAAAAGSLIQIPWGGARGAGGTGGGGWNFNRGQ